MIELKKCTANSIVDLQLFIDNAGNSLDTFRYFKLRPLSCIQSHICTLLLYENNLPIGYGHLDHENGIVWLGICISQFHKGKGLGKLMMTELVENARLNIVSRLQLTVDCDNVGAINLYHKFGFVTQKLINPKVQLMQLTL